MPDNFNSSDNTEAEERVSEAITNRIHNGFNYLCFGIGCFEGTFLLAGKRGQPPVPDTPRRVAYALQKPLKEEIEKLQK